MEEKIHCEEMRKKGFDSLPMDKIRKMIGFYESSDYENDKWEVTTASNGDGYTADSQFEAEVISSLAQIKALLMKK